MQPEANFLKKGKCLLRTLDIKVIKIELIALSLKSGRHELHLKCEIFNLLLKQHKLGKKKNDWS